MVHSPVLGKAYLVITSLISLTGLSHSFHLLLCHRASLPCPSSSPSSSGSGFGSGSGSGSGSSSRFQLWLWHWIPCLYMVLTVLSRSLPCLSQENCKCAGCPFELPAEFLGANGSLLPPYMAACHMGQPLLSSLAMHSWSPCHNLLVLR